MSLRFLKAKPKLNLSKDNKVRSVASETPRTEPNSTDGQETGKCTLLKSESDLQGGEDVSKGSRDATIQRALENDKVIIHSIDSQNVTGNASMKESTSKECDPTVLKKDTKGLKPSDKINSLSSALSKSSSQKSSVTKMEKVSPTKTKSLSSFIKQLENETLLCTLKSSMKSVDKEQKYTKHEECKNVNPNAGKASQEMKTNDQIIENDTKLGDEIKKPAQQEQKHPNATESKSLNPDTVTFSKTRTVFNKGIGNQEKSGDEIKIAKQQEKILKTYQDMNRVRTSTDIKTEDLNKVIEHNKKLGNDTKKHSIQQDFFCTRNEESKNLDSNAVEVSNELNTQEGPLSVSDYVGAPDDNSNSNNVEEEAYADHTIDTYEDNGSCYVQEGTDQYNIIPLTNSVQNQNRPDSIAGIKDTKARKRKNVTFNLAREPYENSTSETSGSPIQNPATIHKKHQNNTNSNISYLNDLSDCSINNDTQKEVLAKKPRIRRKSKKTDVDNDLVNSHIESTINDVIESSKKFDELAISSGEEDIDNKLVKEEYDPDYKLEYESGSDIDNDEREFVIYGKKNTGGKKKVSDSIYLKRQSETLKKIKTESDWKETLTLNDLIFYNPSSNPMTNPPDISVVNKNEKIIDMENNISEDEEAVDNPEPVPQLKIGPDGKLIIDPKSLIIQETGLEKSKKQLERSEALLESKYTIKKIDNLYMKKKFKPIMNEWGPEDTIMFYRSVNTIGTDFSIMATLFENRTRADIKRKFKLEERKNSVLLSKALRDFNNFDIDELKSELDADKRRIQRIKEEENERKRVLKEEKKNEKLALRRSRRTKKCTSLCGQLTQNSSLRSDAVPQYAPPHPKIFQLVKENRYKQLYNQEKLWM